MCSLITKHHITQVVAEDIFKDSDPSKHSAVEVLGMCRGAIIAANTQNNLPPIRFIQPVRVKAEMWGYTSSKRSHREMDRSTQKEIMCRVVEKLGYQLNTDRNNNKDNDEADAIGILVTFLKWNNHPVTHPNKA